MPIVPSRKGDIQALVGRLGSPTEAERESAIARLTLLGPRAVEPLRRVLSSGRDPARLGALTVLERRADGRALPEIVALARDAAQGTARRALEVLAAYPDPRSAAALARALGSPRNRRTAAESLLHLHRSGIVEALAPLVDLVLDEGAEEDLRIRVLDGLRSSAGGTALSPLLARLRKGSSPALARAARGGVGASEDDRVERYLSASGTDAERILDALAVDGGTMVRPLVGALQERSRDARAVARLGAALRALGPGAREDLHQALEQTSDPPLVAALSEALGASGSPASIPALRDALERLSGSPIPGSAGAKARVHEALAALGSRIALYDLREMLAARPPQAAAPLLRTAEAIGEVSLVVPLARLAADEPDLAEACASALSAIVRRERLRRSHPALKALGEESRASVERLWRKIRPGKIGG